LTPRRQLHSPPLRLSEASPCIPRHSKRLLIVSSVPEKSRNFSTCPPWLAYPDSSVTALSVLCPSPWDISVAKHHLAPFLRPSLVSFLLRSVGHTNKQEFFPNPNIHWETFLWTTIFSPFFPRSTVFLDEVSSFWPTPILPTKALLE